MRIEVNKSNADKRTAKILERSRIVQAGVKINALKSAIAPAKGVVKC